MRLLSSAVSVPRMQSIDRELDLDAWTHTRRASGDGVGASNSSTPPTRRYRDSHPSGKDAHTMALTLIGAGPWPSI